jgi:hypothetical protein
LGDAESSLGDAKSSLGDVQAALLGYALLALLVFVLAVVCTLTDPIERNLRRKLQFHKEGREWSDTLHSQVTPVPTPPPSKGFKPAPDPSSLQRPPPRVSQGPSGEGPGKPNCRFSPNFLLPITLLQLLGLRASVQVEDEPFFCALCEVSVKATAKHCRACDKCVEGFDHHCKWLNNCVAARNYRSFFWLVATTSVLVAVHVRQSATPPPPSNREREQLDGNPPQAQAAPAEAFCPPPNNSTSVHAPQLQSATRVHTHPPTAISSSESV